MIDNSSTSHWVIDFATGIMACQAKYFHLKRILSKLEKDKLNGEDVQDKIIHVKKRIKTTCLRRRQKMDKLGQYAKSYDFYSRCLLKHSMEEYMADIETWNSFIDSDEEFYELLKESEKDFVEDLSALLGLELTDCMECLNDSLRNIDFK